MNRAPLIGPLRHQRRYRQIVGVLAEHGFGAVLSQLGISDRFNLPRRLLRRGPQREAGLSVAQRLRLAIEELGPTFIKLGQILSTRSDILPREIVEELARLQDQVPPAPWADVRAVIEAELGCPLAEVFAAIDPAPIASASLAEVHLARLPDGTEVAVKVQRPGIEPTIEEDLAIITDLARLAQQRTALGRRFEVLDLALEFGNSLRGELDFRREGRNADRMRRNFRKVAYLRIPRVYWPYTRRRLIVQERLEGIKLTQVEALAAAGYDRHTLADRAAHIVLKSVLVDGFFHADPHPGNVLALPGNAIGLVDFGTVGRLDARDRLHLVRLFTLIVRLDIQGVVDQLQRMGIADWSVDRQALADDLRRLLIRYYGLALEDIPTEEVMRQLEPIIQRHRLRVPSDYLLLLKTLAVMQGVGLALDPTYDVFATAEPYVRRLLWATVSPRTWSPELLRYLGDWAYLAGELPRQSARILGLVERGDLQLQASLPQLGDVLQRMEAIANRVVYGVLLAAFIVALALLLPRLDLRWPWPPLTWAIVAGLAITGILGLELLWSIFRSSRR